MKTPAAFVLIAMTLAALVAPPAAAQQIWTETRITGSGSFPSPPKVWGAGESTSIWWADGRTYASGYNEIRSWTAGTGETVLTQIPLNATLMGRYQDSVVYQTSGANDDLYLWDVIGGHRRITTSTGYKVAADMYSSTVVWEDYRAGTENPRVYVWDPINGERRISSSDTIQLRPKVWGNRVIWSQDDTDQWHSDHGIYMWTPEGGTTRIGSGDYSAIYQDRIVTWTNAWWEYPGGQPGIYHPGYLNEWTPATGFRTILQHDKSTSSLEMWGDLVVGDGIAWDPVHGFTYPPVTWTSVYGNQIAGGRGRNIYLETLVPEPSSLVTLFASLGVLGCMLRRRTR